MYGDWDIVACKEERIIYPPEHPHHKHKWQKTKVPRPPKVHFDEGWDIMIANDAGIIGLWADGMVLYTHPDGCEILVPPDEFMNWQKRPVASESKQT